VFCCYCCEGTYPLRWECIVFQAFSQRLHLCSQNPLLIQNLGHQSLKRHQRDTNRQKRRAMIPDPLNCHPLPCPPLHLLSFTWIAAISIAIIRLWPGGPPHHHTLPSLLHRILIRCIWRWWWCSRRARSIRWGIAIPTLLHCCIRIYECQVQSSWEYNYWWRHGSKTLNLVTNTAHLFPQYLELDSPACYESNSNAMYANNSFHVFWQINVNLFVYLYPLPPRCQRIVLRMTHWLDIWIGLQSAFLNVSSLLPTPRILCSINPLILP